MKISAQEEYGLRCLLQLAQAKDGQVVTVREIAAKEGLSSAYVEKLLRFLGRAGLVRSLRGTRGGYVLNRSADTVTLNDVIRAMGQVPTIEHMCQQFTGVQDACVHISNCGIRSAWTGLTTYIQNYLNTTTLAQLLGDEHVVADRLANRLTVLLPRRSDRQKRS